MKNGLILLFVLTGMTLGIGACTGSKKTNGLISSPLELTKKIQNKKKPFIDLKTNTIVKTPYTLQPFPESPTPQPNVPEPFSEKDYFSNLVDSSLGTNVRKPNEKSFIACGWYTSIDSRLIRVAPNHVEGEMPTNGVCINGAIDRRELYNANHLNAMSTSWLRRGWSIPVSSLVGLTEDLSQNEMPTLNKNFLALHFLVPEGEINPHQGGFWMNDQWWNDTILPNMKKLALAAKKGGLRGILIDPEPYWEQRIYIAERLKQLEPGSPSLIELKAALKKRGSQLMKAAQDVFPNIEIYFYFMYESEKMFLDRQRGIDSKIDDHLYELYPAFLDGFFEAKRSPAILGNMNEVSMYGAHSENDFDTFYNYPLTAAAELSELPEKPRPEIAYMIWVDLPKSPDRVAFDVSAYENNFYTPDSLKKALDIGFKKTDAYLFLYTQTTQYLRTLHGINHPIYISEASKRFKRKDNGLLLYFQSHLPVENNPLFPMLPDTYKDIIKSAIKTANP